MQLRAVSCCLGVASNRGLHGKIYCFIFLKRRFNVGYGCKKGGFHQVAFIPGVVGAFSSALISGRLMELNHEQLVGTRHCLSLASGSLEFLQDGAWTKECILLVCSLGHDCSNITNMVQRTIGDLWSFGL